MTKTDSDNWHRQVPETASESDSGEHIHRAAAWGGQQRARHLLYAINLSLAAGLLMLCIKVYAYWITDSVAIFSDAAESVVHVFIVCFAAYSVRLAQKPADSGHLYGHERINFFSVALEGMMIVGAGLVVLYEAGWRLYEGDLQLQQVTAGLGFVAFAMVVNMVLGCFLLRQGRRWNSIVLEANGRHVLTDSLTSLGVIVGLGLTHVTGWLLFDPLAAILIALHILWSGTGLLWRATGGLMDSADPKTDAVLREVLAHETQKHGVHYHYVRHRDAGGRLLVDFHLLFENNTTIVQAHAIASDIECAIARRFDIPVEITSHFEPMQGHDEAHTDAETGGGLQSGGESGYNKRL